MVCKEKFKRTFCYYKTTVELLLKWTFLFLKNKISTTLSHNLTPRMTSVAVLHIAYGPVLGTPNKNSGHVLGKNQKKKYILGTKKNFFFLRSKFFFTSRKFFHIFETLIPPQRRQLSERPPLFKLTHTLTCYIGPYLHAR